jgi:ABC-type transport system involved in multi-copper enzyme maturation permease subunit
VARTAAKIRAVAWTTMQDIVRRRVPYLILIIVALVGIAMGSQMALLRLAGNVGETGISASIRSGFVSNGLELWYVAALGLSVFLGAAGMSSEITAKTIVNVLSRPVDRTTYLFGRWLGVVIFLWVFLLVGILLALAVAHTFDVRFVPTLWVGFAEMFVETLLISGMSLGLSVLMHPFLAGALTILVQMLPEFIADATRNPQWAVRFSAIAAYYVAPSVMPGDLVAESFTKQMLQPDYALYYQVLAENFLYALVFFTLACAVFTHRELKLR